MPTFRETVAIYRPLLVETADKNVIPDRVSLVKPEAQANIHRGARAAKEDAFAMGYNATLAAYGYMPVSEAANLGPTYVLLDAQHQAWAIQGRPEVRNRFPETAHVRVLLILVNAPPDGLPIWETTSAEFTPTAGNSNT